MKTGIVVALGAVIAAAAVISGSNALPSRAADDDEFLAARAALGASLERAGVRLDDLDAQVQDGDSAVAFVHAMIDDLVERRLAIVRALDSLSSQPDDEWKGAMAGLRASVTDLEARIDRAELASLDSIPVTDEVLGEWLADAERLIDALDSLADASEPFAAHADEIDSLRESRVAIAERLAEFTAIDDDPQLRARLCDELIALRRRLRALERAAGSALHPRFP